jgi:hypothetical protein
MKNSQNETELDIIITNKELRLLSVLLKTLVILYHWNSPISESLVTWNYGFWPIP